MQKMKSSIGAALVAVAVIAIIASFVTYDLLGPTGATDSDPNSRKEIVVDGVGKVKVDPDQAMISFGVMTQAETATEAIDANAAKMSQVIEALKATGISDDDIKTSQFSLWPIYGEVVPIKTEVMAIETVEDDVQPPKVSATVSGWDYTQVVGYRVMNQVMVTTKAIEQVGQLIDLAVQAGANQVHGVSFSLSEEAITQARLQALELAIEDAQAKADAIASKLDLKIVGVGHVSESSGYYPPYYAVAEKIDSSGATPIEPGQVDFTVSIHIVFLFE